MRRRKLPDCLRGGGEGFRIQNRVMGKRETRNAKRETTKRRRKTIRFLMHLWRMPGGMIHCLTQGWRKEAGLEFRFASCWNALFGNRAWRRTIRNRMRARMAAPIVS